MGAGETIEQLALSSETQTAASSARRRRSDIFYNVSDGSFEVALTTPSGLRLETWKHRHLQVQATQPCDLTLEVNGEAVASGTGTSLSHDLVLDNTGDYVVTRRAR